VSNFTEIIIMSLSTMLIIFFFARKTYSYRKKIKLLADNDKCRKVDDFVSDCGYPLHDHSVVDNVRQELINYFLIDNLNIMPHPDHRIYEDYEMTFDEIEDIILEVLKDYDLPSKEIIGNNNEIATVKDLVDYIVSVSHNYPKKNSLQRRKMRQATNEADKRSE
jgi:hypothetical protein